MSAAHTPGPQVKRLQSELKYRNDRLLRFAGIASLLETIAALLEAPTNRFGKPEFYSAEAIAAREEIRLLAVQFNVTDADTVLHQAARVARAALARIDTQVKP